MRTEILLLAVLLLFFTGCASPQEKLKTEIANQEATLEKNPNANIAESLIEDYLQYVEAYPDDVQQNAKYLYRAGSLRYRMNLYKEASDLLLRGIRDFSDEEATPNSILLLGSIYEDKLNNPEVTRTLYQVFATAFPEQADQEAVKAQIQDLPPLNQRLDTLRIQMYDDSTGRILPRVANDFITSCELYAVILPKDPKTPAMLHQAGEAARSIRSFNIALDLYRWINEKYPEDEKAPQAMFLRAFILDNDLKRYDEARALYETFLAQYPNDDFADDAQFLLDNLGKDDEEIINSFTQGQETQ